jgi:hypothetical protein
MDTQRMKDAYQHLTDEEIVALINGLRGGGYVPGVTLADFEMELERRCDAHLETFGLL